MRVEPETKDAKANVRELVSENGATGKTLSF